MPPTPTLQQAAPSVARTFRVRSVVPLDPQGTRRPQVVAFRVRERHAPVYNLAGGVDAGLRGVRAAVARP